MSDDDLAYFDKVQGALEGALSDAIERAVEEKAVDALRFVSAELASAAPSDPVTRPTVASLRSFVRSTESSVRGAKRKIYELQDVRSSSSRANYLKSLSEVIGPRRAGDWREDWKRMFMEYRVSEGQPAEPEEGMEAAVQRFSATFAGTIRKRMKEGWAQADAEAYTWLSSLESRNPMARAVRESKSDYAVATYALCSTLASRPTIEPPADGQPVAYRNLQGQGGLIESDPLWKNLEFPDSYGFRGITSSALVRPMMLPRYFDEGGFKPQVGKGPNGGINGAPLDADIVGFVCRQTDEHGIHSGIEVSWQESVAFPPNTLFRLRKIVPPGRWQAPGGVYPRQRLLLVTCTFKLPAPADAADGSDAKVCSPPTTLSYGAREVYVRGLGDVLDRPLLSLEEEWARDATWTDRTGRTYSLRDEWSYVVNPVPSEAREGGGVGARDGGNTGKTPDDFRRGANRHIRAQRQAHEECSGLPEEHAYLTRDEVLAVRLYTGPGYQPLNDFLRQLGKLSGDVRRGVAEHAGLTFTATTSLVCSAIRKLAACTSPSELDQPLYRAVRGELPRAFWVEDAQEMVCAVDAGFMSTSKKRETPIAYMGEGSANVLWEIKPSGESDVAFHRGADVSLLSQFAGEEEVLFPPCTMLVVTKEDDGQRHGVRSEGKPASPQLARRRSEATLHGGQVSYLAISVVPSFI